MLLVWLFLVLKPKRIYFFFGGKVGYPSLYGFHIGLNLGSFSVKAVVEQQFQGFEGSFRFISPPVPDVPVIYSNEFGLGIGTMPANTGSRPSWLNRSIDLSMIRISGQWNVRLQNAKLFEFFIKYGFDIPIDSRFYDAMPKGNSFSPIVVALWALRLNVGLNIWLF